jgi:hypothetical protein
MAIDTFGAAVRQINWLFAEGTATGLSDAQLLDRFFAGRDEGAFVILVARHGPMVGAVLLRESAISIPAAWLETTVRAGQAFAEPIVASGVVSAAAAKLSHDVVAIMLLEKLKLVSLILLGAGMMAWGAAAAMVLPGEQPPKAGSLPVAAAPQTTQPAALRPNDQVETVGKFPVRGQVLDLDGKPVAGAEIWIRHHTEFGSTPESSSRRGSA